MCLYDAVHAFSSADRLAIFVKDRFYVIRDRNVCFGVSLSALALNHICQSHKILSELSCLSVRHKR